MFPAFMVWGSTFGDAGGIAPSSIWAGRSLVNRRHAILDGLVGMGQHRLSSNAKKTAFDCGLRHVSGHYPNTQEQKILSL
jgi:hypothetical protein